MFISNKRPHMKKNSVIVLLCMILVTNIAAQGINIIPKPASVEPGNGYFDLTKATTFSYTQQGIENSTSFFNGYLKKYYGFNLPVKKMKLSGPNKIILRYSDQVALPAGGYILKVMPSGVEISAHDQTGVFYGIQSLIQLLPTQVSASLSLPCATIIDSPRFAYRGLHLDCGRHFFSVDFIKQYIDFIALHKMNIFHWHLTEDQGWRIEIKKYPLLTSVGGCRNGTIIGHKPGTGNDGEKECGYYTQDQIRDVVKYAADRYITIIPEIEMPGHASAAIAAYPQLSCFPGESTLIDPTTPWAGPRTGKQVQQTWGVFPDVFAPTDYTFTFLENVLDEVMNLFPSKYIHIGGDECPKTNWKRSAYCQQFMKEHGISDEEGLQSYFIQRIEKYVNSKGHAIIGWDEILEGGLSPNATVMSWRGEKGGIAAAELHHQVIMSPTTYVYFDYAQSKQEDSLTIGGYLPVESVYNYEPFSRELSPADAKYIIGAQANVWSEYMSNPRKVEYMIFPRLSALSEVLWCQPENKNWDDFKIRLQTQFKRYDLWKVDYNTHGIDKGE